MRSYPAIDVAWHGPQHEEAVEGLVLAIIDEDRPLSLEERDDGFRVYFASPEDRDRASERIRRSLPAAHCVAIDVPDEDWAERSQAGLAAVAIDRVVVCPPWDVRQADDAVVVLIQPSMGFGTGHHASTRLCLRLLQRVPRLEAASVLDVGTGSGVLAIAAARLGARAIVAIDSDPDALQSARENAVLNDAANRVELRQVDVEMAAIDGAPFDVVVANLTGGLLMRQAATLGRLLAPKGSLIVSGIESPEADRVAAAFARAGCRVVASVTEGGWVGFALDRRM